MTFYSYPSSMRFRETSDKMNIPSSLPVLVCLIFVLNGHGATRLVEGKTNVHIVYMGEKRHDDPEVITDSHHDLLAKIVGSKQKASELMVYSYKYGFSGFAAKLTESEAGKIAELPGVVQVIPNSLLRQQTTRSWDFLGLSFESHSNLLHNSNKGDGVIIGVFDSGIWPESKSFDDEGLGPVPSRWKGVCESGEKFNAKQHCNRKIIGARLLVDGLVAEYGLLLNSSGVIDFLSPRDATGHGTQTASTAAGSFVGNVSYKGLARGTARGGAPNAHLAVYKVCLNVLGCSPADILKAFDLAIHDGVDVLSLSIGSYIPRYSDVDERDVIATGSFHAVANGISVVCSAGNDGPFAQTLHNTAPWILSVAANSIDRTFLASITLGNNQTLKGQALYTRKEIDFTGLVYPEYKGRDTTIFGKCEALTLNETEASGKVVLCFTTEALGAVVTTSGVSAVREAGGIGLIVAKQSSGLLFPCPGDFPCVEVDYEVGTRILFYIRSTRFPLVKLSPSHIVVGKAVSPRVAFFSSRGPNSVAPAILKPDITAPGVNILVATSPLDASGENGYLMQSGTSISTPHVAGIVALLKALHPSWSPAAIKSALITTAWRTSPSGLPIFAEGSPQKLADPFDFGGGMVNPNAASDPGLVYDMGTADYVHYLCAMYYNNSAISHLARHPTKCPVQKPSVLDVNVPSITIPSIRGSSVVVTRTVTNVGNPNSIYRAVIEPPSGTRVLVKPKVLVFNSTVMKISFQVTISTTHQMNTDYFFGSLTWTDKVHFVRIPLAVRTQMFQTYGDYY